jgi:hypothetical protein
VRLSTHHRENKKYEEKAKKRKQIIKETSQRVKDGPKKNKNQTATLLNRQEQVVHCSRGGTLISYVNE